MSRLTLILGGARSGKSDYAEQLAQARGGDDVLFVATAEAGDDEMRARIEKHRSERDMRWRTLEATRDIAHALKAAPPARVVLLDCVTLWVANVWLSHAEMMIHEVEELLDWQRSRDAEMIIVSNEVGMGIVPDNELARGYRDLLGAVNKKIAAEAAQVYLMVAGIPLEVKTR